MRRRAGTAGPLLQSRCHPSPGSGSRAERGRWPRRARSAIGRNGVTADAAVRRLRLAAHGRPRYRVRLEHHQAGDGVGGGHTVRLAFLGRLRDVDNVRDVGSQFGEEGNLDGGSHPLADIPHQLRFLTAGKSHASLAHAVWAGEVELERIRAGSFGLLGQFCPVLLIVAAHNAGDQDLFLEVAFELGDAATPIVARLLRDELDVEEGALARGPYVWPEVVPRTIRGDTFVTRSLFSENVLVTLKPQPDWNERRIMGAEVVGGAEARPNGLGKRSPQISTLRSTKSTAV